MQLAVRTVPILSTATTPYMGFLTINKKQIQQQEVARKRKVKHVGRLRFRRVRRCVCVWTRRSGTKFRPCISLSLLVMEYIAIGITFSNIFTRFRRGLSGCLLC
jgi:hypothetical protein